VHVDVSIDDFDRFPQIAAAIASRARHIGLPDAVASGPGRFVETQRSSEVPTVIGSQRTESLLSEAGFEVVAPFFRGFWYSGMWAVAV
jgi:hypothetical protein